MPKDSSAKYYQNKKENKTIKNVHERCQSLSKEEKEKKCINIVMNDTKTYSRWKKKSLLSIKINIINWEKKPSYNYNKLLF